MCRHCERLVEDAKDKDLMHAFMASVAEKVNRKINEDITAAAERGKRVDPEDRSLIYREAMKLHRPVTADDCSLSIHVEAVFWHDNPFNGTRHQIEVYRMLQKMFE